MEEKTKGYPRKGLRERHRFCFTYGEFTPVIAEVIGGGETEVWEWAKVQGASRLKHERRER